MKTTAIFALALSALMAATSLAEAQSARVRVRGVVEAVDAATITVKSRAGEVSKIALKPGWSVAGVTAASLDDIKPGDYVGIASVPKAEGGDGALEVLIFPAAMKGTGEGVSAYDLKPNSSMTNATVSDVAKGADGKELTLTFKGGERKMSVPAGAPIVTFAPATQADLVPGAAVIVTSEKAADGSLSASRVAVGLKGLIPPM